MCFSMHDQINGENLIYCNIFEFTNNFIEIEFQYIVILNSASYKNRFLQFQYIEIRNIEI